MALYSSTILADEDIYIYKNITYRLPSPPPSLSGVYLCDHEHLTVMYFINMHTLLPVENILR